jgi:hypothetical protein
MIGSSLILLLKDVSHVYMIALPAKTASNVPLVQVILIFESMIRLSRDVYLLLATLITKHLLV